MKKVFMIAGLATALLLTAVAASAQTKPNFGGAWALDKTKSQGLDQRMQGADITWVITQDDTKLSVENKVANAQPPAGGGGGGMGRGMGGPRTYMLDGKETTTEMTGGSSTSKATWSGSTLELMSVRTGNRDGQEFKFTTTDKLSLSGDGKTLTVNRHSESPRGPMDSTMVFNKQ
jgi:hypothetical protein